MLAYCARCERYAAVTAVRNDGAVGDGPAHVCEECRDGSAGATTQGKLAGASGERAEGSDRRAPIVPHTGQSTDLIAAGPER